MLFLFYAIDGDNLINHPVSSDQTQSNIVIIFNAARLLQINIQQNKLVRFQPDVC